MVVLAVVIGVVIGVSGGGSSGSVVSGVPRSPRTTAVGRTSAPPWSAPAEAATAVQRAGLTVPANIGIDQANGQISTVHAHDATGAIHIESPAKVPFIILAAHDEIAIVYGAAAQQANPPSSYTFDQGE